VISAMLSSSPLMINEVRSNSYASSDISPSS
jgi:hypothetical protein